MAAWVTIEDMYDHDRHELGPFSQEEAYRYCDAVNGQQLRPGAQADVTPAFGVWNKATAPGYDFRARMAHLLARPEQVPPDADAIAAAAGARTRHQWRLLEQQKVALMHCWCSELLEGRVPEVDSELASIYRSRYLEAREGGVRLHTDQHFGEVTEVVCTLCRGTLLHLMIEHEGYGNCIQHYYVPVDADTLAATRDGRLHSGTLEAWFDERPGMHTRETRSCFYRRAEVGYAGIDSSLEF